MFQTSFCLSWLRVTNSKASLTLFPLRKMAEPAKKKQTSFFSIFKNVPNTDEASSNDSAPLLDNTSGMNEAKSEQSQKSTVCSN